MHHPFISHTLAIFAHLRRQAPPLAPAGSIAAMDAALLRMKENHDLTTDELEETMIVLGKRLWPHRKAFAEFLDVAETELGEKFLLARVSRGLKKRYEEFKAQGGTLRHLHTGHPAAFFNSDELVELGVVLVDMNKDVRQYATQRALSTERRRYEDRVISFQIILDNIEKRLDTLRRMADDEREDPEMAAEIREQARSFEYGLCLLESEHQHEAICRAEEHFRGRKKEKAIRL